MLIRLPERQSGLERLCNPETGTLLLVDRTHQRLSYVQPASLVMDDAQAAIDAVDEILARQDEDLAVQRVRQADATRGTVKLIEGDPRVMIAD